VLIARDEHARLLLGDQLGGQIGAHRALHVGQKNPAVVRFPELLDDARRERHREQTCSARMREGNLYGVRFVRVITPSSHPDVRLFVSGGEKKRRNAVTPARTSSRENPAVFRSVSAWKVFFLDGPRIAPIIDELDEMRDGGPT